MEKVYATVDINQFAAFNQFRSWGGFVNVIIRNAITIVGIIAFFFIILGGIGIIGGAGSGDSKQMEKGKQMLTGAVLGLVVVIGAVWIVQIIGQIAGVNITSPPVH